jgi:hypothetical protein
MEFGTFILDFQTINFESDSEIARNLLNEYQSSLKLQNAFALDEPITTAGWSFAKLFLSAEFVEKLYERNGREIDRLKGKRLVDKIVSWLAGNLQSKNCSAQLKIAREMVP